ncbi:MAG: hypothetical protein KJ887_00130 [Candidatus Omnitrophica bacterium]|nr:hypothetical protein [Candidatus Omnitrophota bacterium]MBU1047751.1 hypothetical protein [Candidatus Omnitrophota bacterium]MBU1631043.1 hypothetical protein [Candidatus Omnitrophota bacterium]MBU1889847.1 hypothetical protein [Candidatus Omnitrophota bacterium]
MEWIKNIEANNFLAIYDVLLDINEEASISPNRIDIPIMRSVVRFEQLFPADGINFRDEYCSKRWKALNFLKEKNLIADFEVNKGASHRWLSRVKVQVNDLDKLQKVLSEMHKEYNTRTNHMEDEGSINKIEYIDKSRLKELKNIRNSNFDLSRLIEVVEEIDKNYNNQCYLSVILLTRTLIDHVPLIFKFKNFSEVTNNYKGAKSFKESMEHLDRSSRKIADTYLHCQIRKQESLPNKTQVNFSNDIDVLLGEIVRLLK